MADGEIDKVVIVEPGLEVEPHPLAAGVQRRVLLTRKDHSAGASIFLSNVKKGVEVPEHLHKDADDIAYILSGRAKMFIEGIGEIILRPGVFVRVPKNVRHSIYDFDNNFSVINIFVPATV